MPQNSIMTMQQEARKEGIKQPKCRCGTKTTGKREFSKGKRTFFL